MIGQTLSHYRILEQVGAGGMGVVYRAHDERLDRDVALKILPPGTLADEAARKRFRQEALTLSRLNHPNIETVHDFDTQGNVDFLVMEFIPGVSLDKKLAEGALTEKEISRLGVQVADGLAAACQQGVVHRDLKPSNLLVTEDGRVKILDFGIAKLLQPVSETVTTDTLSETRAAAGTLPYMSPEQLRAEKLDSRSDIWAAGAVLYEMATGRRAFPEYVTAQLTDAILHKAPEAPRAMKAQVSPELERIILKCLEKEPEDRYQSARELSVDLRRLGAPATVPAVPRKPALARRAPLLAAGASLVLLAILAGFDAGGWRERLLSGAHAERIQSLAILPFKNLSGDKEQEYFADAMTDMLTTDLAQISALRVTSTTSVMQYKKINKPLPEIARELNVDAIVEGSVLRAGDRVRITAQLIRGPTDRHLWAQTYDREVRDILAMQSEVARRVTQEIGVTLTPNQEGRLSNVRPVDPQAQEAYLRGKYAEGSSKSELYFRQAIQLDPAYAAAYVGLASLYYWRGFGEGLAPKEAYPKAKEFALQALRLDPDVADAHAFLASVNLEYEWNFTEAEKEFRRALELNPNQATTRHLYGHYLLAMGRGEESREETQRAAEIAPLDMDMTACVGWHCIYTGKYSEAEQHCRKVLQMDPENHFALTILGWAHEQQGRMQEAIAELEKALPDTTADLAHAYAVSGRTQEARKILAQMITRSKHKYVSAYEIAVVQMGLGNKDEALAWLEKAYEEHSSLLIHFRQDPRFQPLHSDPRFQDLARRLGLPST